jgi:hypothetical protein
MHSRRKVLIASLAWPACVSGCIYGDDFQLDWSEDVRLLDGRVIVIHLKHRYERLRQGPTPYSGLSIPRDTELTFDAGGAMGKVTQMFVGYHPMFLDQYEGTWYGVIYGSDYGHSRKLPGGDWGPLEGPYGQWAIKLVGGRWQPLSMRQLPEVFKEPNVLMLYAEASELSTFDGRRITLKDKAKYLEAHPLGYAHTKLTRPLTPSTVDQGSSTPRPTGGSK